MTTLTKIQSLCCFRLSRRCDDLLGRLACSGSAPRAWIFLSVVLLCSFKVGAEESNPAAATTTLPSATVAPALPGAELVANPLNKVRIEGQLLEKGSQSPLPRANVFIMPQRIKAETDDKGNFTFEEVPEGDFQFVVNMSGYFRLEENDNQLQGMPNQKRKLFLEKESYSLFETTVRGQKDQRDDSSKSLKQAQFATLPGAGGDPVKAVQNLPGVNRVGSFSSQVVIQGSAPNDTRYDIDGHEIPLVFHFGGLTSVVMPEAVDQVDYFSAGYGPEYGRALGGIVSLKTRKPDLGGRESKGFVFIDLLKAGGLVEKQLSDESSLLLSARYSYVGLVLRKAFENDKRLNLTVAPEFSDITAIYHKKLNERDELKVVTLASRDTLGFLLKEPVKENPTLRGNFSNETNFYRFIPQWTRQVDSERILRASMGVGQDQFLVDIGDNYFRNRVLRATARAEWDQKLNSEWRAQWGLDESYSQSSVDLRLPVFNSSGGVSNPISGSTSQDINLRADISNTGVYWRNEYKPSLTSWTFLPNLRADYFSATKESYLQPRFGTRYQFSESLLLKAATGLYVQPPEPQEVDSSYGNPAVKSPRAIHATFGFEKDFRENSDRGFILNSSYFDRWFDNLVIQSSQYTYRDGSLVPEKYNNSGRGRAYGVEAMLKAEFAPYTGWLSYTVSRSTRWDPNHDEYTFQYDQTHNLNLVGSVDLPRNWKISSRFRYVTGNPRTPVIGASFDADNDVYVPKRGPLYSERAKDFSQLDLRVDKKWIAKTGIWTLYLDIQNVLGTKNAESIRYAYDYSTSETIDGVTFLPTLGLKGEF